MRAAMHAETMTYSNHADPGDLREEIAATAARFIAEDGMDYAHAKQRAAREVVGGRQRLADCMPDNALVEAAVREHQSLFMADTQPVRLARLRRVARDVLVFLAAGPVADPVVVGAIVNGTAGEHSEIHVQVRDDNAKDIEIYLLNTGIDFDVTESPGRRGGETLSFLWPPRGIAPVAVRADRTQEAVHLAILDPRDRGHASGLERADLHALDRLIADA